MDDKERIAELEAQLAEGRQAIEEATDENARLNARIAELEAFKEHRCSRCQCPDIRSIVDERDALQAKIVNLDLLEANK